MKIYLLIFLVFLSSLNLWPRELKVESFEFLGQKDLTAQTSPKYDLNGMACAVIKVSSPEGIKFEGNVIATVYDVNEYVIYVSHGTKNIIMKYPGYETLYLTIPSTEFPSGLESGRTYRLKIGGVENNGATEAKRESIGANYVVFKISPEKGVSFKIDNQIQTVDNGEAMSFLKYGQHSYFIEAEGYAPQSGNINVKEGDTQTVNVTLESIMASLNIDSSTKGSSIFINGQNKGTDTWSGPLSSGLYNLEVTKDGHQPYKTSVELAQKENKKITIPSLEPIYGTLQVEYKPIGATILVDGKSNGATPKVISDILVGEHIITIKEKGYEDYSTKINLIENEPVRIFGTLSELKQDINISNQHSAHTDSTTRKVCSISGTVRNLTTKKPMPCIIRITTFDGFTSMHPVINSGDFYFNNLQKGDKLEFLYNGKVHKEIIISNNSIYLDVYINL